MELKKLYESMLLEKGGQRREGTHIFYQSKGKKVIEYFESIGITAEKKNDSIGPVYIFNT